MKLNLNKPLVVFDLETTGLDLVKDRIIQISYIKVTPDGKEERGDHLINPECEILPIITQLTGISNEDVKDKPTFKQLAKTLARHRLRLLEVPTHRRLHHLQEDGAPQPGLGL